MVCILLFFSPLPAPADLNQLIAHKTLQYDRNNIPMVETARPSTWHVKTVPLGHLFHPLLQAFQGVNGAGGPLPAISSVITPLIG